MLVSRDSYLSAQFARMTMYVRAHLGEYRNSFDNFFTVKARGPEANLWREKKKIS